VTGSAVVEDSVSQLWQFRGGVQPGDRRTPVIAGFTGTRWVENLLHENMKNLMEMIRDGDNQ